MKSSLKTACDFSRCEIWLVAEDDCLFSVPSKIFSHPISSLISWFEGCTDESLPVCVKLSTNSCHPPNERNNETDCINALSYSLQMESDKHDDLPVVLRTCY